MRLEQVAKIIEGVRLRRAVRLDKVALRLEQLLQMIVQVTAPPTPEPLQHHRSLSLSGPAELTLRVSRGGPVGLFLLAWWTAPEGDGLMLWLEPVAEAPCLCAQLQVRGGRLSGFIDGLAPTRDAAFDARCSPPGDSLIRFVPQRVDLDWRDGLSAPWALGIAHGPEEIEPIAEALLTLTGRHARALLEQGGEASRGGAQLRSRFLSEAQGWRALERCMGAPWWQAALAHLEGL